MVNIKRLTEYTREIPRPRPGNRLAWLLGRGNVTPDRDAFFVWQDRALDALLSWGVGNIVGGTVIAVFRPGISRAIAVQAIAWGTLDAAVAIYAQCTSRRHATSARAGLYSARHIRDRARRFEYLLAVQTGADVLYITIGSIIAARSRSTWIRGTAIGVIVQGCALLLYDMSLVIRMLLRPELRFRELDID